LAFLKQPEAKWNQRIELYLFDVHRFFFAAARFTE
jgi:hypothetical protein